MWNALLRKEFRETAWLAAAALAAYLLLVATYTGWTKGMIGYFRAIPGMHVYGFGTGASGISFVNGEFVQLFSFISALLAIGLGFRQTMGESLRGTYPLLLRLPMARANVFRVKLLAGLTTYLVSAAVPIVLFGALAATPGTHASPFYWAMTEPAWVTWWSMSLLYVAAFLCGLRPARWLGSRLLPLVAGFFAVFFLWMSGAPWQLTVSIVLVLDLLLLICVQHAGRIRDFS